MSRGYSLDKDLKSLLKNPTFCDLKIKCSDSDEIIYASKAVLAARSQWFATALSNGMYETHQGEISFPEISVVTMKKILEFIYTGRLEMATLSITEAIEIYNGADYLELQKLANTVFSYIKDIVQQSSDRLFGMQLIAEEITRRGTTFQNPLCALFSEHLAKIPLESIPYAYMRRDVLEAFLASTLDTKESFFTSEYGVFRYVVLWAANQISPKVRTEYEKLLPKIDEPVVYVYQRYPTRNLAPVQNHETTKRVKKLVAPFLSHINFAYIPRNLIAAIIDPLDIIPIDVLRTIYRQSITDTATVTIRGVFLTQYSWNGSVCGTNLSFSDNFTTVTTSNSGFWQNPQIVTTGCPFSGSGLFSWTLNIEAGNQDTWIGLCGSNPIDYNSFQFNDNNFWLVSPQRTTQSNINAHDYLRQLISQGLKVKAAFHLDMLFRSCTLVLNGRWFDNVWTHLPEKIYVTVALKDQTKIQITKKVDLQNSQFPRICCSCICLIVIVIVVIIFIRF